MAKKYSNKGKDIKDRIKKQVPSNDWFLNVGKSMGFATQELIQELMPNTSSTVDWNKNVINIADMVQDIRDNNGIRKMFGKQLGNIPAFKVAQEGWSNAKADLKSGNIYNKNRAMGLNDDGEFSFDDFSFDNGGVEFIDDDDSGGGDEPVEDSSGGGRPPVTVINTMPLAKAISSSAEANVNAIASLGQQQFAMESEKLMMNKQSFEGSMSALNSINENLALLVQFNSDSTAKYQAAALKYFEQSLELMEKPEEDKKKKNLWNPFTAEGGLKLDEYAEVVKENIKDIKDSNIALSTMYDIFDNPELIKGFSDNPIGTLMTAMGRGVINKKFKEAKGKLGELDKNLNMIMPALLARVNTFEGNQDDNLLQTLNKVFGYKYKLSYDVDLGDYEKGAISWDGESKKALVEVIPSYLRRIESVLTGGDERIYNYSTGKFDDIASIEKFYNDKLAENEVSGFTNVRSAITDVVNELGLSIDAKDQVMKDFNNYFRAMTKQGYLIRHNDPRDSMKMGEIVEYDKDREKLLGRILDELPNHIKAEMATMAISDSRERTNNFMEEVRLNPNLSGYSYLKNDLDKDGKMRYTASKTPLGLSTDNYGLNQLDYLRDIRSALIKGIRVFPDHTKRSRGNQPNADILAKERLEENAYEQRIREEEEARQQEEQYTQYKHQGRSVRDAVNIPDSNWKEMFKEETPIDQADYLTMMDKLNNKVSDVVYNMLYGEDNYQDKALEKLNKMYQKGKPILQNMKDFFGDTMKAFRCFFTGQGYVTSDGVRIEGEDSLLGSIKTSILGIKDKFSEATREGGMFQNFFDDFMDGFDTFKTSLFGEKKLAESKGKETFQNLMSKVKQRLPKALGYGLAGGMVKTVFASNLGLLGNFLMPGGPIASVLMGTTFGFLKQSETFNRYMFGEKDENGERVGGLISKAWQDKYQEYKGVIGKGAGIGILGSLFLPGGPVAGAIMGIAGGIASKNEAFQEFLYGKDYKTDEKKSMMNGVFGKAFKQLSGSDDPKLAKFLGSVGAGIGVAQGVGLLPSFLLPGGPIMGAMLGLAGGIAASSNKFQEFLLGEKDIDGQRHGGLLTKAANWFSLTFAQPLKLKFTEFNDFLYGMFRKHIFDPLARSFEPIVHGVKNVFINAKDSLVEAFSRITHPIVEAFKENIIKPISTVVKKVILNPIKWIMKKTFGFLTKSLVGLITAPISIVGRAADMYNSYSAVRQEKFRRRREYDKNTPKEERNYHDRKKAGKLTREEKKELRKNVSYRNGKTWGEYKKEQKEKYKEEMSKRKERRDEMKRQFEEDKKFAKENGYKYRSKKQQEQRERELREKEIWFQEQQLMQAQDTDEKVEKISDNVIKLSDYQNNTTTKLDVITNTVREGFNKLTEKLGLSAPSEEPIEEDHMTAIYDFLDRETERDENVTLKEALDDLKGEFRTVLGHLKETDKVDTSSSEGINPNDLVNITDEDLNKIYSFLDNKVQQDESIKLKGALDDLPADFKAIFKNKKSVTVDTGDNKVIDFNAVRKQLRDDDQSHADGLDKVPSDGYLAELHEGEMVVPEKPAGKLRNLMDKAGKGFSGLTDVLAETSENDVDGLTEDRGIVENSLLKGTIKGLRGMAKLVGGIGGMFGKLGNIIPGERRDREDNAMQLSDMEADQLKEMEDKARYDHASRKNADYIQEQMAAENKEKADRKWKDSLLNAIKHLGGIAAAGVGAGMNLFDLMKDGMKGLLDKFGGLGSLLGSLALPFGIESLIKMGDDYINSPEYKEGYTDVDADGDGEGDEIYNNWNIQKWRTRLSARKAYIKPLQIAKKKIYDPLKEAGGEAVKTVKNMGKKVKSSKAYQAVSNKVKSSKAYQVISDKVTSSKLYNKFFNKGVTETGDNVIDLAAKRAAKEGAESATTKVFKETAEGGAGKVINFAEQKLMKEAAESGSGKVVGKVIGEGVEAATENKGIMSTIVKYAKQGVQYLADLVVKKFPAVGNIASRLLKAVDPILTTLIKNSDSIIPKYAKKITATLGKATAGAATGMVLDAVFAVGDLATGLTAGNAGNLFGVSPENVDARMRIISSIFQTFFNFSYISIVSLVNEITNAMFNYNFIRQLAIAVYNFTGGKAEFGMRITAAQIDKCASIDEALQIMGVTDYGPLKDGSGNWKDFSAVKNEELGGVITEAEQMELARLQYNLANGTKLSSQGWIDKESQTFGSKVMAGIKKAFKRDTAQQKYNKLTNKAAKKTDKANEYREKAKESKTVFGKAWNNSMAWLNDKSAARAEKKAEKTKVKAAKKLTKAQGKVDYHTQKAEESKGIFKAYHNWRANVNQKKVKRYTMDDGKVTSADRGTTTGSAPVQQEVPILKPEEAIHGLTMAPGETVQDEYGNVYDHTGKCISSPNWGHAGMGDGDDTLYDQNGNPVDSTVVRADKAGNLYDVNGNPVTKGKSKSSKKKSGKLAKLWDGTKNLLKTGATKVGKGIKAGATQIAEDTKAYYSNPLAFTLNKSSELIDKGWSNFKANRERKKALKEKAKEEIKAGFGKVKEGIGTGIDKIKNNNKVKEMSGKLKNIATEGIDEDDSAGTKSAKVVKNITIAIQKAKKKMLDDIAKSVKDTLTNIGKAFKDLGTNMLKKLGEMKDSVIKGFGDGIKAIGTGFKNVVKNIGIGIGNKVNDLKTTFSKENLKKTLETKVKEVNEAWGNLTGTFNKIFGNLTKKFSDWKEKFNNFKLPNLKLNDIGIKWKDVTTFFTDFAKELFNAGSSGPKASDNIKPVKHNISSTELLKPMVPSTNNTTTTNKTNNKFVFYNQSDARWGQEKIGDKTIKDAGCGPTSLAMAVSQLTGEQITPDTIAKLGSEHLPGYSKYSLFPSIADKLNMNYKEGTDSGFIISNLKKGIPVVLSGKSGIQGTPYTSEGHIVTASHMSGNRVYIQDPRGENYSKYYPLNALMTGLNKGMIMTPSTRTDVSKLSSGSVADINLDKKIVGQDLGVYDDSGEYSELNSSITDKDLGKAGAGKVRVADRVLSYMRAFLANTSKFKYSQAQNNTTGRYGIDNNNIGADCSSFVSHVLTKAGDAGKVSATSQVFWDSVGTKVSEPQIGDVVCQQGHVGLYSGDGNYIHMSGKKYGIKESKAIQRGNNPHRGYKRVLKNPDAMVDPTIVGGNSLLGTVVATSSGYPVGGGATSGGTTSTDGTSSAPAIDELGVFGKLKNIGTAYLGSLYNGDVNVFDQLLNPSTGTADTTTPSNGSSPDISGISDTATAVWKFFTGKGYSNHATAGIMGNLQQESSMDPTKKQYGGGPGRGIAQWTVSEGRFKGLEAHAKSKGKDWTDLQSQLEWIDMELAGKDSTTASKLKKFGGLDGFKKATDYKWAVEAFEKSFERAGKPNYANRYKYAQNYYDKMANAGMGPAMATSAEAAPSDGSIPNSMNGWKYYQQSDSRWGGKVGSSTVSRGGCGPTSAAMMLSTIFGKEINPLTMTRWANSNGSWTGAMQWNMPDKIASAFGLGIQDLGSNANGAPSSTLANVKAALKAGKPVMLTGRGTGASGSAARTDTPFTPGGHVVLAVGLDGNGNVIINDPRGASRTKAYTDDGIMNVGVGLRGAWAFNPDGGSIPSSITTDGDFTGGTTTGGTTSTDGTSSAPAIDELGVFGKLKNIGMNYLASIYNGKDVDLFATSTPSDGNATPGGDGTPWNGTKYDLSKYDMSGLSGNKLTHINKMIHPTLHTYKSHGLFPSLTLAQAAQESGWGLTSGLATKGNAAFGIKADKSWTGKVYTAKTREVYNGKSVTITDGFRAYDSLGDSIIDRANFLKANSRYTNAGVFSATSPEEQARAFQKAGYATDPNYASSLINLMNGSNLQRFDKPKPPVEDNAGSGDGNTYLVAPKENKHLTGDAGKGDGRVSYSRSIDGPPRNRVDAKAQRELEAINRKVNVAFNNINASDPNAYAEVLKIILQELQAINANTAATAEGVGGIEIASANAPVSGDNNQHPTTKERYQASKRNKQISKLQTINSSTGYSTARQIAGYKKTY